MKLDTNKIFPKKELEPQLQLHPHKTSWQQTFDSGMDLKLVNVNEVV